MSTPSLPAGGEGPVRLRVGVLQWRDAGLVLTSLALIAGATLAVVNGSSSVTITVVLAISIALGMHARQAMGRGLAAVEILFGGVVLAAMAVPPRQVAAALIGGLCAAELVADRPGRSAVLRAVGWTAMSVGIVMASGLAAAYPMSAGTSVREALFAGVGALLAAPFLLTIGPALERLFGHTTRSTMSEWLNYDHPLLRELASRAPGTFQHSINVGVLADAAARAIGADALVARVGALYHDVGKLRAPELFSENQHGANPHDTLPPWESARIVRAHVSDGVRLIAEHHMGSRIAEFAQEHHGTGAMRLFRDKAHALGEEAGPPDETYRYAGPRPRSRETAIVMIADQLEATARATPRPTKRRARIWSARPSNVSGRKSNWPMPV